uniref:Tetratricopeptide repeat protein n=1 Tax=candidate division CPR3 bacterium TaxID=2268181 RepID=A0A7C4M030_UNCC3
MKSFFASQKKSIIILAAIIFLMIVGLVYFVYASKKVITDSIYSQNKERSIDEKDNGDIQPISLTSNTDFKKLSQEMEKKVSTGSAGTSEYINLGLSYYNLKEYDKSIEAYKKAISYDTQNAAPYAYIGNVYRDKNDLVKAEEYYRKAISVDPKFTGSFISLAVMKKVLQEDTPGAIQVLNEGLTTNPEDNSLKILLEEYGK